MAVINTDKSDKMIDMGYMYPEPTCCDPVKSSKQEKSYPHLYIDHAPDSLMSEVKVGEMVKFTATGIIRTISVEKRDGKTPEHRIEMNIHSMSQIKKGE